MPDTLEFFHRILPSTFPNYLEKQALFPRLRNRSSRNIDNFVDADLVQKEVAIEAGEAFRRLTTPLPKTSFFELRRMKTE